MAAIPGVNSLPFSCKPCRTRRPSFPSLPSTSLCFLSTKPTSSFSSSKIATPSCKLGGAVSAVVSQESVTGSSSSGTDVFKLTYLEGNSWLWEVGGLKILVDPILMGNLDFGIPWLYDAAKKFLKNFQLSDLPEIDCLLITQSLDDHCHLKTLKPLSKKYPNLKVLATPNAKELLDPLFRNETKWTGEKANEIGNLRHKSWYTGWERNPKGVGILVDKTMKDDVVEIKRIGDRIIMLKLVLGNKFIYVISAYAPQIGLDAETKVKFWEDMDDLVCRIGNEDSIFIGGDFNGHVGKDRENFERIHGGFGFGARNEEGKSILEFALGHDFIITNTFFKKRDSHLITFKNGRNSSQIDYFLTMYRDRSLCKNCKVIPGEVLATQHRLVILDVSIKLCYRRIKINHLP